MVATAVLPSALEWLAKLIAMLILQHYRGELYMFYDDTSVQMCAYGSIVTTHSWVDRLARKVLQLPVYSGICECWLPAQHGSQDQGQAARWQAQSDKLATFGKSQTSDGPLPWSLLMSGIADVLILFFCGQCVFHRARFLSALLSYSGTRIARSSHGPVSGVRY